MRPGRGVAEWHMLPSWNSLHTLLVARAVLLWHGASYPMLRCSSLARHPDLGPPTVPCARRPLFWYPIPVRIGSPTGDAWLTCQCASQSACSAFHNIRRLSLPSLAGEGTSHCAICFPRRGGVHIHQDRVGACMPGQRSPGWICIYRSLSFFYRALLAKAGDTAPGQESVLPYGTSALLASP